MTRHLWFRSRGQRYCLPSSHMDSRLRVLVVDDEPAIRALVARIVERAGLSVDCAKDGADAIEMLNQRHYSVIVLDLMMPKVDGYPSSSSENRVAPAVLVIIAALRRARLLDGRWSTIIRKPVDIDVSHLIVVGLLVREPQQRIREGDVPRSTGRAGKAQA